jgi:hypothetical protein
MSRGATCGECRHYAYQQATHGLAPCHGFDGERGPVEPFVRWDGPYCIAYDRAPLAERQARGRWMAQQKTQQSAESR